MEFFKIIIGYVFAGLLIGLVWFFSGFYKKKVIIRWIIQVIAFLFLSSGLIAISIFVLVSTKNTFWFGVIFTTGFWTFIAFLFSIYFLINRGIIFPKKKKKVYEDLKKRGFPDWQIKIILTRLDD